MVITINIGTGPDCEWTEPVSTRYNAEQARKECQAFIGLLTRFFGAPPTGATFEIATIPGGFNVPDWFSVFLKYDIDHSAAIRYAYRVVTRLTRLEPAYWDDEARAELGIGPHEPIPCIFGTFTVGAVLRSKSA